MTQKNIPFEFVFDYLFPFEVKVKPMFGIYAIYINDRIVLALRQRADHPETNGVWVATSHEHHLSLKKEIPSLHSISIFTKEDKDSAWQVIPADNDDFESAVIKVCELVAHGDPRIGSIPQLRNRKIKSR